VTDLTTATLNLAPDALSVREVGPWLRAALRKLDPDTAGALLSRMELAVHEVCMNVVNHARLPAGSEIELSLALDAGGLTVCVRDPGEEFNLAEVPNPPERVLQEHGYGIKIVRALVTELSYRHTGTGNELALRIDLGENRG
jgi:anti-sigma regulatory factor (Ser/Thr protein kinase)